MSPKNWLSPTESRSAIFQKVHIFAQYTPNKIALEWSICPIETIKKTKKVNNNRKNRKFEEKTIPRYCIEKRLYKIWC